MSDHLHTPPPSPASRTSSAIPPELDALILECLEKDPDKRPASARALQTRLQAIAVDAPWTRERAEAWWSAHAPDMAAHRSVADVVLSQEAHPRRVIGTKLEVG
jgi:serine/threonine-protein kinase